MLNKGFAKIVEKRDVCSHFTRKMLENKDKNKNNFEFLSQFRHLKVLYLIDHPTLTLR